eukprot:Seg1392.2 transcript_id=Seg1392.2/GoldUCD/mRNA.D3Y31 product="hypothetical protein" protein_id=Seg1392.2/GoldUCD/D3Y31
MISNGKVISILGIQNIYKEFIKEHGDSSTGELPHLKTLKSWIQSSGVSNDSSILDNVREVALRIRKEVLESSKTFSQWPPSEDELLNLETVLPKLLETLIGTLLTKRNKPSSRKQRRIQTIGQDIVYSIKNGKDCTMKHVLLWLSGKRKTGSRQVLHWLNKFGHGISYDKVCYLETSIAQQQTQLQFQKNFIPATIQPSQLVTFVWNNNDINPETLTGVSMYSTNGIVIQKSSDDVETMPNIETENSRSNVSR